MAARPSRCPWTLRRQFGSRCQPPASTARLRRQCGKSARLTSLPKAKSQISRSRRTATTPARQSGRKIRRQPGNLEKTLRRQIGKSSDRKKVRNILVLFVFIGGQVYWVFPHLTTPCYLLFSTIFNDPQPAATSGSGLAVPLSRANLCRAWIKEFLFRRAAWFWG